MMKWPMVVLGVLSGGAAWFFLTWRQRVPVLVPGVKTTRVKPVVVVVLLALAALCFVAAASDSGRSSGDEEPPAQTKPVQHRHRR
jgi:hypothetical protein